MQQLWTFCKAAGENHSLFCTIACVEEELQVNISNRGYTRERKLSQGLGKQREWDHCLVMDKVKAGAQGVGIP